MAANQRMSSIRVVLADDHPMLRDGTAAYLNKAGDMEVVGTAGDGATAIALVTKYVPDVLILDVHLPDLSGVEVARLVKADFPRVGIIILTGYDDSGHARSLRQLGIDGYLQKTASGQRIVAEVRAVAIGLRTSRSGAPTSTAFECGRDALTSREQEVIQLLDAGLRNAEIAATLSISPKTVEYHISNLLAKLGARSRTEAVLKARQRKLRALETSADGVPPIE